jgi:hypothetical protein
LLDELQGNGCTFQKWAQNVLLSEKYQDEVFERPIEVDLVVRSPKALGLTYGGGAKALEYMIWKANQACLNFCPWDVALHLVRQQAELPEQFWDVGSYKQEINDALAAAMYHNGQAVSASTDYCIALPEEIGKGTFLRLRRDGKNKRFSTQPVQLVQDRLNLHANFLWAKTIRELDPEQLAKEQEEKRRAAMEAYHAQFRRRQRRLRTFEI